MKLIKILLAAGICAPLLAIPGEAMQAELGIRWIPSKTTTALGSVSSIADTLKLDLKKAETDNYIVSYYKISLPTSLPANVEMIARKRVKNGTEVQLTTKYRSAIDVKTLIDSKKWECPLAKHFPRIKPEIKYETDITFGKAGAIVKLHSLSCTIESRSSITFPSALQPEDLKDSRTMQRTKIGNIKIDKWKDSKGQELLEVSTEGIDSDKSIANFYNKIAYPLIRRNIDPILDSKSGSQKQ